MTLEIIAEAAQGYAGDNLPKALALVDAAAAASADAVKFQLVYADELCTADYVHFALFRSLEMPDAEWRAVAARAAAAGVRLYFDVFGERSLALADSLGVHGLKLHSTDLFNHGLIRAVASASTRRVILSAGGAFDEEVDEALTLLDGKDVVVMHGFQGYPTDTADNQIARIAGMRHRYAPRAIGFADHVVEGRPERFWLSALAVGAGATVLEKHITRSLVLRDEDYESALNPDDFAVYCANMRLAFSAMGAAHVAQMSPSERAYREKMKKHVVAARALEAGAVAGEASLGLKRTSATGDVLRDIRAAAGRTLRRRIERDAPIRPEDLV